MVKKDAREALLRQREAAKIAMTISLAVAVFTGPYIRSNRGMRLAHVGAGVSLVACSIWHHRLYEAREGRIAQQSLTEPGGPV
ncbi:MAG: hypothetical protein ACOX4Z_06405 [Desulfobulbus sp.]|jgi:uncharacterized membrane protein